MSTLLSELDSAPAQGDGDFVANILNEMNGGGGAAPIQPPPAVGSTAPPSIIQAPNPNTIAPHVMDNSPMTAHMIGNSQPTPADFANLMGHGGGQVAAAPQGGQGWGAAFVPGPTAAPYQRQPKKSWMSRGIEEFRTPMLVALLVFVFGLPVVNFLFAHYLPSLVKPTGELTVIGSVAKALTAGAAFWVLQRVVVPLLTA